MQVGFDLKDEFRTYSGTNLRKPEMVILMTHMQLLFPYLRKQMIVLDAGCGLGQLSKNISQHVKSLASIDASTYNIFEAKKINYNKNIEYIVGDVTKLSFRPETFDIIVSSEVIEHISDYKKMIKEIDILGKRGCYYSLSTPNLLVWILYPSYWIHIIKNPVKSINILRMKLINKEFIDIWINPFSLINYIESRGLRIIHFVTEVFPKKKILKNNRRLINLILDILDKKMFNIYGKIPVIKKYKGFRQFLILKKI